MEIKLLGKAFSQVFLEPLQHHRHYILVIVSALIMAVFLPVVKSANDWELNTAGLWNDILNVYQDTNRVYPPWGIILLLPFRYMHIAGAKFFSVLTVSLLVKQRKWPFYSFFLILLSPFFIFTMYLVNMDILVIVFPVLLWEMAADKSWQGFGRGVALSLLLLKPQATALLWLFLIWQNRLNLKSLLVPGLIVGLVTIPMSLIGTPPLFIQWLNNIFSPSSQNQFFWSFNNISLNYFYTPGSALLAVVLVGWILIGFYKRNGFRWDQNSKIAALLMASMLISPYTSKQSMTAALAFVPSISAYMVQFCLLILLHLSHIGYPVLGHIWAPLVFFSTLITYPVSRKKPGITFRQRP